MASSADKQADLYWKAYFAALMDRCGGPERFGGDRVLFLAPDQERGIPASKYIPMAITNHELYQIAGFLLKEDSAPIYSKSNKSSAWDLANT